MSLIIDYIWRVLLLYIIIKLFTTTRNTLPQVCENNKLNNLFIKIQITKSNNECEGGINRLEYEKIRKTRKRSLDRDA